MKASAPAKATGKLTIQIGLLSIPVKIYSGIEQAKIERHLYIETTEPGLNGALTVAHEVGYTPAIKLGDRQYGDQVKYQDLVKKYETSHGLIDLTDQEIAQVIAGDESAADTLCAQPYEVYDNDYVPSGQLWQVRPEKAAEKAFSLLLRGLLAKEAFLVLRWVKGGTAYVGALFHNGTLVGLRWEDEIRELLPLAQPDVSEKEIKLSGRLIETYLEKKPLTFTHPHNEVRAYAEAKAAGSNPTFVKAEAKPTLDLANALEQSIAAAVERAKVPA